MPSLLLNRVMRKLNHHRTTEVYFIGYPKTGNTWVQFMLGRYLQNCFNMSDQVMFDSVDMLGRSIRFGDAPTIQFTHRPLTWKSQTANDLSEYNVTRPFMKKRVVLIVRHPLDTMVSSWCQWKYQVKEGFQGSLEEFLSHPVFGLEKYYRFYNLWHKAAGNVSSFHLLRYEDMRENPIEELRRLAYFLLVDVSESALHQAVKDSSFENMRKLEESQHVPRYPSSGLKMFATGDRNNPDAYHVRKGKVGGYKDYLEAEVIQRYEHGIARSMGAFYGYGG